jgi:serine/threonine kinase PknH
LLPDQGEDALSSHRSLQFLAPEDSAMGLFVSYSSQDRSANPPKRVFAGAVEFPSAESAHAFVRTSAGSWKACAGQTVTVADGKQTTPWTFSELNGAPPRIMQRRTRAVPNGRVCQRVLSAVSRVVIDVVACGTSITNEAGQVADQMAAKVTP